MRLAILLLLFAAPALAQPPGVPQGPRFAFTFPQKSVDSSAANIRRLSVMYSLDGKPKAHWWGLRFPSDRDGMPYWMRWTASLPESTLTVYAAVADSARKPNWSDTARVTWRRVR